METENFPCTITPDDAKCVAWVKVSFINILPKCYINITRQQKISYSIIKSYSICTSYYSVLIF